MIWSPLAGGRVFTGQDERAVRVRSTVEAMAHELGIAPITLITAWLRRHPSQPLPILGSRRIEVAREAMAALPVTLDAQQWYRLWEAAAGREVP
jgi:predicted oxidoreductase